MNDIELINQISKFGKNILNVSDLEKILEINESSGLRTVISRLVKRGVLTKLGNNGIYSVYGRLVVSQEAAGQIYYPSYISCRTALSQAGIIDQIPLQVISVTSRKSYKTLLNGVTLVYRQIKPELYFGYYLQDKMAIAYPEKAILDLMYFAKRGGDFVNFSESDWKKLDVSRLKKFNEKFKFDLTEFSRTI